MTNRIGLPAESKYVTALASKKSVNWSSNVAQSVTPGLEKEKAILSGGVADAAAGPNSPMADVRTTAAAIAMLRRIEGTSTCLNFIGLPGDPIPARRGAQGEPGVLCPRFTNRQLRGPR